MSTNGQAKVLTHDEIARLFGAMGSPRDQALFGILLYCGLRVSEAISLRPGDIKGDVLVLPAMDGLGISTHSFRRTALTNLSNAGVPLRVIQEISVHRSLASLQRYLEVSPEQKKAAIAALGY
ncbi:tyrosine-type recombinase/integrase [Leptolyngbya sp. CCNP1308]|uniref:tyrosine-type recombinase/integrase n=1 Tax=Leptolyngbya sp. CCNP1308 TaxID=3110255 RepID=UPI002B1F296D|nr:tyrosine-type recombinase/integrase [Leptolyngbya sp. CCNP1308]MEA5452951.1 tyrosine-type recombinase/integrase [Leptolyngbya sp. CCNP1308]